MKDAKLRQKILRQLYDLAFGECNDPARLLFMSGQDALCLDELDLRRVVSLHKAANGGVEVKMLDRSELIELLLEATEEKPGAEGSGGGELIAAIDRAAARFGSVGGVELAQEEAVEDV